MPAGALLEAVIIESDYRGAELPPGRRSVAFRLTFRAPDRTLRDAEIDEAEGRILGRAGGRAGNTAPRCRRTPAGRITVAYHYERPDQRSLSDLEQVLHHVAEELAGWRRRTLKAEGELQEARANGGVSPGPSSTRSRQRVMELEMENQALRQRIDAREGTARMLSSRLSFLEQHGGGNAA